MGRKTTNPPVGEPTDFENSKLILMWGRRPGDGTFGTGTMQYLKHAKKRGARIICVDPRITMTSKQIADEHIFIRPSTDAAALIAMTHASFQKICMTRRIAIVSCMGLTKGRCLSGASYRSYLSGLSDGQAKTPEWAAAITGIPAETIRRMAIEFALAKPAALQAGDAAGRTIYGEQFHRAAYALAAITGNVGIRGEAPVSQWQHRAFGDRVSADWAESDLMQKLHRRCWRTCWRAGRRVDIRPISE